MARMRYRDMARRLILVEIGEADDYNVFAPLISPRFTGTPTVNGVPIGSGGSGSGILLIDNAAALPAGTPAGTIVVLKA